MLDLQKFHHVDCSQFVGSWEELVNSLKAAGFPVSQFQARLDWKDVQLVVYGPDQIVLGPNHGLPFWATPCPFHPPRDFEMLIAHRDCPVGFEGEGKLEQSPACMAG